MREPHNVYNNILPGGHDVMPSAHPAAGSLRVPIKPGAVASESTRHNGVFEVATPPGLLTSGSRHKAFIASHGY